MNARPASSAGDAPDGGAAALGARRVAPGPPKAVEVRVIAPGAQASPDAPRDWTGGPAKWAAVAVLCAATAGVAVWSNLWRVPNPVMHPPAPAAPGAIDGRLDVNRADALALEQVPGVGPALAGRIVADREAHGPFASVDDLGRVPGIGPTILETMRPLVRVAPAGSR